LHLVGPFVKIKKNDSIRQTQVIYSLIIMMMTPQGRNMLPI